MSSPFRGATAVQTHGAILDLIRSSGVVSRTELVDRSGLTGASITRIVRQLLDDGLITEIGLGESTGRKTAHPAAAQPGGPHGGGCRVGF